MKDKVMDQLQRFSKAMFIPVLILPIAGILIAVGNLFTNAKLLELLPFMDNPVTKGFGTILSGSLVSILNNLGLIFCVGLAAGLANKKKYEAGFTALLGFLVFINAMNKFMALTGILFTGESLRGTGQALVLGVQILDMGVFLGIILGIVTAMVHNRFCETEFQNAFHRIDSCDRNTGCAPYLRMALCSDGNHQSWRIDKSFREFRYLYLRRAGTSFNTNRPSSPGLYSIFIYLSWRC